MLGARNTAYRIKIIVVFCTFAAVNFLAESAREQEFTFKITTIFEPTVGVWESWEPLSHRIQHGRFARGLSNNIIISDLRLRFGSVNHCARL